MARSNHQFKKRQKELARKMKKEQKIQRKLDQKSSESGTSPDQSISAEKNNAGIEHHEKGIG